MKKHYVAEMMKDGAVVGSCIASIWAWKSCRAGYSLINLYAQENNCGVANFRRVR